MEQATEQLLLTEVTSARNKIAAAMTHDRYRSLLEIARGELRKHASWTIGHKKPGKPYFFWPSIIARGHALQSIVDVFVSRYSGFRGRFTLVHSGGMTFGSTVHCALRLPRSIPVMPHGYTPFTPGETLCTGEFSTAYASREPMEIAKEVLEFQNGDAAERMTIILDDAVEDGGTALAIADLLEHAGYRVVEVGCIYTLGDVGIKRLAERNIDVFSIAAADLGRIQATAKHVTPSPRP